MILNRKGSCERKMCDEESHPDASTPKHGTPVSADSHSGEAGARDWRAIGCAWCVMHNGGGQ